MYDLIPFILGTLTILLGVYMVISLKNATKEELRNDEYQVKKTKKNGFIVIICGIVIILVAISRVM